ncbi:MAG: ABC-2 type transporter [Berkelbacteria bacterium GW2011_GWB1_38_5]|uniref:ABC-2 type transporter n=1 Tax=Berkelbacteria bacterium GW2011_GWB1_38_5 TaxID=1618336 RepID=A0A0G0K1N5_9BACT|nr:MAG: ABC-2 type transporter [Berkelbacteria bacterium GW2011_GWB1_38_5]
MLKLFFTNLKMMVRGRQALFWSLFFPLMFTIIFGFFFGGDNKSLGAIVLINKSDSQISQSLEKALDDSGLFKVQKETDLSLAKDLLKKSKVSAIVEVPEGFGNLQLNELTKINLINDPANTQINLAISGFLEAYLTQVNYQAQGAKPIFSLNVESTSDKNLTYFDFVLLGIIGMALMNGSVQGIAITMARYREDKILKRITTTPLKPWKFVLAEVLSRLILNVLQISLILAIGVWGFHAHIVGSIFLIYLFALLGGLLFLSIGFAVASAAKTTDAAQGMAVAITIPMMFLAGVFFPIDQLPKWLYSIVQYLPLAPLLRMIRQIGIENISPFINPVNIIIVVVWIIITLFVSVMRFRLSDE